MCKNNKLRPKIIAYHCYMLRRSLPQIHQFKYVLDILIKKLQTLIRAMPWQHRLLKQILKDVQAKYSNPSCTEGGSERLRSEAFHKLHL